MKLIPLTQGQFAKVDDVDFRRFAHLSWRATRQPGAENFYATSSKRHGPGEKQKTLSLHREILSVTDPKIVVDHINHDTLDCRRKNLRACTHSQNLANRSGAARNSASGVRGVCWHRKDKRWNAQIEVRGIKMYLGNFHSIDDAAAAYAAANKKYFGEFGGKL